MGRAESQHTRVLLAIFGEELCKGYIHAPIPYEMFAVTPPGTCNETILIGTSRRGNGFCDADLNTADCGWDNGDCCSRSCTPNVLILGATLDTVCRYFIACSALLFQSCCPEPQVLRTLRPVLLLTAPQFVAHRHIGLQHWRVLTLCTMPGYDTLLSSIDMALFLVAGSCSTFPTCNDPNINVVEDTVPPQLPPLPHALTLTYTDGLPLPSTISATDNDPCFNTCARVYRASDDRSGVLFVHLWPHACATLFMQ